MYAYHMRNVFKNILDNEIVILQHKRVKLKYEESNFSIDDYFISVFIIYIFSQ